MNEIPRLNVHPVLVENLELMLEAAKAGQINELLIIGSGWAPDGSPTYYRVSHITLGEALAAFENWKLRYLEVLK